MATQALERRPPLNWRGALATTDDAQGRDMIDLKLQGTAIFVDVARLYALAHGVAATGTRAPAVHTMAVSADVASAVPSAVPSGDHYAERRVRVRAVALAGPRHSLHRGGRAAARRGRPVQRRPREEP